MGATGSEANTFQVSAAFDLLQDGREVRLTPGSQLAVGNRISLSINSSRPVYVYVVNQDDNGEAHLLFPLTGLVQGNPIPGGVRRLPGLKGSEEYYWQVTSASGREHFYVYVATKRLVDLEQLVAAVPRAQFDVPIDRVPVPSPVLAKLRGVGGLSPAPPQSSSNGVSLSDLPLLPASTEQAHEVWARRITFVQDPQ
jgi:hypothetical protein